MGRDGSMVGRVAWMAMMAWAAAPSAGGADSAEATCAFHDTPAPPDSATPAGLLQPDQLNANDLQTRDAATLSLIRDPDVTYQEVISLLSDETTHLEPEQVERLLIVAEAKYLDRPGVIGIQMRAAEHGVVIASVFARSPAAELLEAGDLIVGVNGRLLPESSPDYALQRLVSEHQAGDEVTLDLERDGKPLRVSVRLANADDLEGFANSSMQQLRRNAWRSLEVQLAPVPVALPAPADWDLFPFTRIGTDDGRPGDRARVAPLDEMRLMLSARLLELDEEINARTRRLEGMDDGAASESIKMEIKIEVKMLQRMRETMSLQLNQVNRLIEAMTNQTGRPRGAGGEEPARADDKNGDGNGEGPGEPAGAADDPADR